MSDVKICCGLHNPDDGESEPEGQVLTFHVTKDGKDWGTFDYCEACVAQDRKHGFTCEEV